MTTLTLANYARWKANVATSSPWDDASLLSVFNIAKDNISQAIVQVNPNYFGQTSRADTIAGQQDYQKPSDLLLFKRLDVSYTDTNPGSYYPATLKTLADLMPNGEDWYAQYQPMTNPLFRFDGTQFYLYPRPQTGFAGTTFLRLWYVTKRADLANLTDNSSDIETLTGIGYMFHELIGDMVVNQIRFKKGELSQEDVQNMNNHILDELVPAAFRIQSTVQSSLPKDSSLQYCKQGHTTLAATFEFEEDNGTQTGSPLRGTSTTAARTENNWKNIDDSTTAYSSSPITAGNNSFSKYQYAHFSGTYNSVSAGLWAHTAGAFGSGLTLKGLVSTTYATPSASTNASLTTDMTSAISIGSGAAVLFTGTGPYTASPTSSITANPGYSQYLITQLQTTSSAGAGDTTSVTLSLQYQEN